MPLYTVAVQRRGWSALVTKHDIGNTHTTKLTHEEKRNIHKPKICVVWPTLTTAKVHPHAKKLKKATFQTRYSIKSEAGDKKHSHRMPLCIRKHQQNTLLTAAQALSTPAFSL
jgi:hypothetical protein